MSLCLNSSAGCAGTSAAMVTPGTRSCRNLAWRQVACPWRVTRVLSLSTSPPPCVSDRGRAQESVLEDACLRVAFALCNKTLTPSHLKHPSPAWAAMKVGAQRGKAVSARASSLDARHLLRGATASCGVSDAWARSAAVLQTSPSCLCLCLCPCLWRAWLQLRCSVSRASALRWVFPVL